MWLYLSSEPATQGRMCFNVFNRNTFFCLYKIEVLYNIIVWKRIITQSLIFNFNPNSVLILLMPYFPMGGPFKSDTFLKVLFKKYLKNAQKYLPNIYKVFGQVFNFWGYEFKTLERILWNIFVQGMLRPALVILF